MVSEESINGELSVVEEDNPIETHQTKFSVGEKTVRIKIDVVTKVDANGEPHVESDGRVWVNGKEAEDAKILPSGPEMFNIAFPPEHPIVEDHTRTHHLVGEYESNIVVIPSDYHQRTFNSYWDAHKRLAAEKRRKIEQIDANVSIVETIIDEDILYARSELTSTLASVSVKYSINRNAELNWTFEQEPTVQEDQLWLLHTAARMLAPIDYDDYIGQVILNSQTDDDLPENGSTEA